MATADGSSCTEHRPAARCLPFHAQIIFEDWPGQIQCHNQESKYTHQGPEGNQINYYPSLALPWKLGSLGYMPKVKRKQIDFLADSWRITAIYAGPAHPFVPSNLHRMSG
jgi:hypothetical protein